MDEKLWSARFQENIETNGNKLLEGPCSTTNLISQLKQEENCDASSQLQENVEAVICETEKYKIQQILEQVSTLKPIEKLLLYLKLPTESSNNDPLRQPLNPLGSRTEISQTIIWIRTHLEQDQDISLQKKAVYDEYQSFCDSKKIKPLSTADFGKVMKQVYPTVKPRRLGVRGQSQYCYSGLRKRVRLNMPMLPDLSESEVSYESDLTSAAWNIIREWCILNFKKQFHSLPALAYYLIITFSIGTGSTAANTITNAFKYQEDGGIVQNPYVDKHRETTMLLQRKIQEKNEVKEQKRKNQPGRPRSRSSSKCKRAKGTKSQSASPVKSHIFSNPDDTSPGIGDGVTLPEFSSLRHILNEPPDAPNEEKHRQIEKLEDGHQSDCNPRTSASCSSAHPSTSLPNTLQQQHPQPSTSNMKPSIRHTTTNKHAHRNKSSKSILPKQYQQDLSLLLDQVNDPAVTARKYAKKRQQQRLQQVVVHHKREPSLVLEEHEQNVLLSRERLNSISTVPKEDLDDYLMGTSNSQEQSEEEIMSYFDNNNDVPTIKLQHLRQCLIDSKINEQQPTDYTSMKSQKRKLHHINPNVNIRRRVSFDTPSGESTSVPPSPNTRRRNFNFTPIGVTGDTSPTGGRSMCSSTNESPFVSPRNTPVPRARGQSHPHVLHPIANQHRFSSHLELQLTLEENKTQMNMPMRASAPPSPKGNYNYLNNKTNNYGHLNVSEQSVLPNANDLTQELNQLLANNSNLESINLRSKSVPVPYYNNLNIIAQEAANYDVTEDHFQADMSNIVSDLEPKLYIDENAFSDHLQSRMLARSQSIQIDTQMDNFKFNTRSVPSTPVSCPDFKVDVKSYPRNPAVAPDSAFNFNHDFLINGQRIKNKNAMQYKNLFDTPAEDTSENFLNQLNYSAGTRTEANLTFDETVDPNNLNY